MRADRLVALLLLLQRRGRITAAEAAVELEVSPRTARRDLEALAMSGVPVYSTHGRGGGWQLIGGASTDLSGLSADEARALFLAAGPAVTATPELKSALRKLTSALPTPFQAEAEAAAAAFKIDPSGWGQVNQPGRPRFLDALTEAVIQGCQVSIDYQGQSSQRRWRTVHPLGLVTKRNVWYLVAGVDRRSTGQIRDQDREQDQARNDAENAADNEIEVRTYRLSRVRGVEVLTDTVRRPPSFDLDRAWDNIVTEVQRQRTARLEVKVMVQRRMLEPLRWVFGYRNVAIDEDRSGTVGQTDRSTPVDGHGPVAATVSAYSAGSFAAQIASFTDSVELVDPPVEVTTELATVAQKLFARYGQ